MRTLTRLRRLAITLAATLVLAAQIGTFAHSALTSHGLCRRHGGVVHQAGAAVPTAARRAGADGNRLRTEPADPEGGRSHSHGCVFLACARNLVPFSMAAMWEPPATAPETGPAFLMAVSARPVAILAVAPKHSPPSA